MPQTEDNTAIEGSEGSESIQRLVSHSVVTFCAGLNVAHVVPGFNCCRLVVPGEEDIAAFFTQQGVDRKLFCLSPPTKTRTGMEVQVDIDSELWIAIAPGLVDIKFEESYLSFETGEYKGPSGMNAANSQVHDSHTLTISFRAPTQRWVVTYPTPEEAQAKSVELDGIIFEGRRLKVVIDQPREGYLITSYNSIFITNISPGICIDGIPCLGSTNTKQVCASTYNLTFAFDTLKALLISSGGLYSVDDVGQPDEKGILYLKAHFSTWQDAKNARDCLHGRRFDYIANRSFWLKLSAPFRYTISLPYGQYVVQRKQWHDLKDSISNAEASNLILPPSNWNRNGAPQIRVVGSDKRAFGVLKVRAERLAQGETALVWHPSWQQMDKLLKLQSMISAATQTFVRVDRVRQLVKVYGGEEERAAAKDALAAELERLKNTGNKQPGLPSLSSSSPCPICLRNVVSPSTRLSCGHTYCTGCLRCYFSSAADARKFPLLCTGNDGKCTADIPIPIIQKLLSPAAFDHLLNVIFRTYVEEHFESFRYCRTPECTQVYRCTEGKGVMMYCPSCFGAVCSACHEIGHEGVTCAEREIVDAAREQEASKRRMKEDILRGTEGKEARLDEKSKEYRHVPCR
jgi:hypothetical protein